jgi:hypothetical protein
MLFEDSPRQDEHRPGAVQLLGLAAGEIGERQDLSGERAAPEGKHHGERRFHEHLGRCIL